MLPGQSIMGQAVGAYGAGGLNLTLLRSGLKTEVYLPGELLELELTGFPGQAAFVAARLSDGGGELHQKQSNDNSVALTSKCTTQMYSTAPIPKGGILRLLLKTPCDNSPSAINISVVAAANGFGPFFFQSAGVRKEAGRANQCPPAPLIPTPAPYPFNYPLPSTCPNGAAAQHGSPCPSVPCISPEGKNGTCLVITSWPDQVTPGRNGSIMAESRVELLTDAVTPISHHYVTGSPPPQRAWTRDMTGWRLKIDGQVAAERNFTMGELQALPHVSRQYVLECASNWGRGMSPVTQQADWWAIGGVSCSNWTGVLLRDVLELAGVNLSSAVYVGWYGEDEVLQYCTHTALILCSYCTHTVLILDSYCTHTVLILCSYCTHTARTHTVLILHSYCTYSYCTPTALLLHSYCTPTALLLHSYCTPTALLLHSCY
jgi:hypothetical protein